jgi:hypothetical protein
MENFQLEYIDTKTKVSLNDAYLRHDKIFITNSTTCELAVKIVELINESLAYHQKKIMKLEDGLFLPFPYSTLNERLKTLDEIKQQLKDNNSILSEKDQEMKFIYESFITILNTTFKEEVNLLKFEELNFIPFGIRILTTNKNGLDIHCENAFLHQLSEPIRTYLREKIDIENTLSFFITIQKPEQGGALILFDVTWDEFSLQLDTTTYQERHDLNGSLFKNKNKHNVKATTIELKTGEGILFSAAQIWHGITPPLGIKDRFTLGCFIGKGWDGKFYFWA